jgi:hypothetical protein
LIQELNRAVPTFFIPMVTKEKRSMIMKNIFFLSVIVFIAISCKKEEVTTTKAACTTVATVRDLRGLDGCGFVFELENGKRLEPLMLFYCGTPPLPSEVTENPLNNFEFVDGKKVKIGYEILENQVSICMVGDVVKITCLQEGSIGTKE